MDDEAVERLGEPLSRELLDAFAALEELSRERYEVVDDSSSGDLAPFVLVVDEAPGVFVQDGRVHRAPLVDEELFRALLRAGRKCEPTFTDVVAEFSRRDLLARRRRAAGGSGTTEP